MTGLPVLRVLTVSLMAMVAADAHAARNVFLITDYGIHDFYVGALKGAVLQKSPSAGVHDLTHSLVPFDIRGGAFVLSQATGTLPRDSVVVAVVDPGVGTRRRNLALLTRKGITFVGPDNGLFTWVIRDQGLVEAREIKNPAALGERAMSTTFHGRDIYGPAGGWLSAGGDFAKLGPVVTDPVQLPVLPAVQQSSSIKGQILLVDHYGNILTNIPHTLVESLVRTGDKTRQVEVMMNGQGVIVSLGTSYASVPEGQLVGVFNSLEMFEVAINQGNAGARHRVRSGDVIEVKRHADH